MDSIKDDIHAELKRLRLDKRHLYTTLLRIIDALPQEVPEVPKVEEVPVVPQIPEVVEVPKVEEVPVVPEKPMALEVPPTPKKTTKKKKVTLTC